MANTGTLKAMDLAEKHEVDREIPASSPTHTCPLWVQYLLLNPFRRLLERPRALLEPHVRPGMVVAEPGCGFVAFSLDLAELVGPEGRVLCVDIEPRAIEKLERRARRRGLGDRIQASTCARDDLGLADWRGRVDLVVLLHMLHEVPDQRGTLEEVAALLAPGGRLLLAEPPAHISQDAFQLELARCRAAGLREIELPGGLRRRRSLFARSVDVDER